MNAIEAAEHLGLSERTIRRWIASGKLPAEKKAGEFQIEPTDLPLITTSGPISELDALRMIARIMDALDVEAQTRVLRWAADRWNLRPWEWR